MNKLLLFAIAAIALPAGAQTDYLVTTRGDTLYGKVHCLRQGTNQRIEHISGKKRQYFNPVQVLAFRSQGEDYHTVKTANGYQAMKLIKAGYLSLYAFQPEDQMAFSGLYLLKKDGSGMEFSGLMFKKRMVQFMADCPAVSQRLEEKELKRNDLDEIIDLYNACIEQKTISQAEAVAFVLQWHDLEEQVKQLPDFESKADVLDMIREIRNKADKGEPVPRFLRENLRSLLSPYPEISTRLEKLLGRLQN